MFCHSQARIYTDRIIHTRLVHCPAPSCPHTTPNRFRHRPYGWTRASSLVAHFMRPLSALPALSTASPTPPAHTRMRRTPPTTDLSLPDTEAGDEPTLTRDAHLGSPEYSRARAGPCDRYIWRRPEVRSPACLVPPSHCHTHNRNAPRAGPCGGGCHDSSRARTAAQQQELSSGRRRRRSGRLLLRRSRRGRRNRRRRRLRAKQEGARETTREGQREEAMVKMGTGREAAHGGEARGRPGKGKGKASAGGAGDNAP